VVESFSEVHNIIGEKIRDLAKTETIVGEPIQVGETSIIPVVSIMAGWGAGVGTDKATPEGSQPASGGGGGIRITPVAFIVVKGDDVSLLTLKEARISKIAEIIPTVIESIKAARGGDASREQDE
jgi:uncharacterized spore protein YtfJ